MRYLRRFLLILVFFLSIILCLLIWKSLNRAAIFEENFSNRLSLLESRNINLNKDLTKLLNNSIDRFEQKYSSLSNFINSSNNQFLLLENIDYLLFMANHYLITVSDYNHAIYLLERAKSYLDLLDCGEDCVSPLRSSISRNIDIFSKANLINTKDYLLIIDDIYDLSKKEILNESTVVENNNPPENIDNNYLKKDLTENRNFLDNAMSLSRKYLDFIFQASNKIIKINKSEQNDLFIKRYEALSLFQQQLLIAKFSLVTNQNDLFKLTTNVLEDIVDRYFDKKSKFVLNVTDKLSFLSHYKLNENVFDISDTLAHMRNMRFLILDKKY